jgi:hypothetical protein
MGSEIVTLHVGPKRQHFSVHKNLLAGTCNFFRECLSGDELPTGKPIMLEAECPSIFKLFIEFLYTKAIPRVQGNVDRLSQSQRLRDLCQLYAFTDKYHLENRIKNSVIDAIQDGFLIMNKLPESGLVTAIYGNTQAGSKLRLFSICGLIHNLQSDEYTDDGSLTSMLQAKGEILIDFLNVVRGRQVQDGDPRIRDCGGDPRCVECAGCPRKLEGLNGVWPCLFHVHQVARGDNAEAEEDVNDESCYLWS